MSDTAPVTEPVVDPTPPPEPVAAPPSDDEAAIDAALDKDSITINHAGDKLVPLAAVAPLREKVRTLKPQAERAATLEQENQQLKATLDETRPLAEAFKAMAAAQQHKTQDAPPAAAEDDTEAVEFARHADLYNANGQPDVVKAKALLKVIDRRAEQKAKAEAAPIVEQSLQQQATHMLARAKATEINGQKADPAILENLFNRVAAQPGGLESLTKPEHAAVLVQLAYAQTQHASAGKAKPAAATPLPPPLPTEPAGGKDSTLPALNAGDRKTAKDLGLSDTEYAKRLQSMPWRK